MQDYYEIDFLSMIDKENKEKNSGDCICIRVKKSCKLTTYVVDCGYDGTHEKVLDHFEKYYDNPGYIDKVVVTHTDQDHASGIPELLENIDVKELWMICPWNFKEEIKEKLSDVHTLNSIEKNLREKYCYFDKIEKIALSKGIPIYSPFQGSKIEDFLVLHPSKEDYIDLIVTSDKAPVFKEKTFVEALENIAINIADSFKTIFMSWGEEKFPTPKTTNENEMSVVQFAELNNQKILLTGDVGVKGLEAAADFSNEIFSLPGIDRFQAPHHGGRRNLSSEILDRWLGPIKNEDDDKCFSAMISASEKDKNHPKKTVVRALIHRGGRVITTQDGDKRWSQNAPDRPGWVSAAPLTYPDDAEAE